MKYRKLTIEELKSLEPEFVRFLSANTVTADDWEKVKNTDLQKAEELIILFSDVIIGQTLEKITYLDLRRAKDVRSFHCQKEKIILRGLLIEGENEHTFNLQSLPEKMLADLSTDASLQIINAEKAYNGNREDELFKLMEQGALISKDGNLFSLLGKLN